MKRKEKYHVLDIGVVEEERTMEGRKCEFD